MTQTKILVVGATGYLGAKIVTALKAEGSAEVRAMSRRAGSGGGVEWVKGDLMDPASLDAALRGVDVVITSANGYMKETIAADFEGNRNLVEAATRAGVKRFVFLSVVSCEKAPDVPHFHAKAVAEDLIRKARLPFVFVRAPAFLDQADDYIAKGVRKGKFYGMGDKDTRWSYVLTDDLAGCVARAALHPDRAIEGQTIDIGWREGPMSQRQLAGLVAEVTGRKVGLFVVPWAVLRLAVGPLKLFSALGYDLVKMMLFFRAGSFVADTRSQERFFGPAPSARDAVTRWARRNGLVPAGR